MKQQVGRAKGQFVCCPCVGPCPCMQGPPAHLPRCGTLARGGQSGWSWCTCMSADDVGNRWLNGSPKSSRLGTLAVSPACPPRPRHRTSPTELPWAHLTGIILMRGHTEFFVFSASSGSATRLVGGIASSCNCASVADGVKLPARRAFTLKARRGQAVTAFTGREVVGRPVSMSINKFVAGFMAGHRG